jgi:ribosomal-protein-alanine N-acetyltransferase
MEFIIREATIDDLDQIYIIEKECFPNDSFSKSLLEYYLRLRNNISLVIEYKDENPRIIGYIMAKYNQISFYEILTINVKKSFRRQGLGTRLMLELEKEIISKLEKNNKSNQIQIELVVYEKNTPAYNMYVKLGFVFVEILPKYYSGKRNGIRMIKKIT